MNPTDNIALEICGLGAFTMGPARDFGSTFDGIGDGHDPCILNIPDVTAAAMAPEDAAPSDQTCTFRLLGRDDVRRVICGTPVHAGTLGFPATRFQDYIDVHALRFPQMDVGKDYWIGSEKIHVSAKSAAWDYVEGQSPSNAISDAPIPTGIRYTIDRGVDDTFRGRYDAPQSVAQDRTKLDESIASVWFPVHNIYSEHPFTVQGCRARYWLAPRDGSTPSILFDGVVASVTDSGDMIQVTLTTRLGQIGDRKWPVIQANEAFGRIGTKEFEDTAIASSWYIPDTGNDPDHPIDTWVSTSAIAPQANWSFGAGAGAFSSRKGIHWALSGIGSTPDWFRVAHESLFSAGAVNWNASGFTNLDYLDDDGAGYFQWLGDNIFEVGQPPYAACPRYADRYQSWEMVGIRGAKSIASPYAKPSLPNSDTVDHGVSSDGYGLDSSWYMPLTVKLTPAVDGTLYFSADDRLQPPLPSPTSIARRGHCRYLYHPNHIPGPRWLYDRENTNDQNVVKLVVRDLQDGYVYGDGAPTYTPTVLAPGSVFKLPSSIDTFGLEQDQFDLQINSDDYGTATFNVDEGVPWGMIDLPLASILIWMKSTIHPKIVGWSGVRSRDGSAVTVDSLAAQLNTCEHSLTNTTPGFAPLTRFWPAEQWWDRSVKDTFFGDMRAQYAIVWVPNGAGKLRPVWLAQDLATAPIVSIIDETTVRDRDHTVQQTFDLAIESVSFSDLPGVIYNSKVDGITHQSVPVSTHVSIDLVSEHASNEGMHGKQIKIKKTPVLSRIAGRWLSEPPGDQIRNPSVTVASECWSRAVQNYGKPYPHVVLRVDRTQVAAIPGDVVSITLPNMPNRNGMGVVGMRGQVWERGDRISDGTAELDILLIGWFD